jgi:hypothetical protein
MGAVGDIDTKSRSVVSAFPMSQEDYPVKFVLDSIEAIMPPANPQPKVL